VPAGIGNIFQKWINVTTKPGAASFATELETANWGDVWISLLILGVITAVVGLITSLALHSSLGALSSYPGLSPQMQQAITNIASTNAGTGSAVASIVTVPIVFFIVLGILFVVAKMFGGQGTFLQQSYAFSLFYVPISVVSRLVGLVPCLGSLVGLAGFIYSIVLAVFAVSASQRLSTGRSVAVVLLPAAIILLLGCALLVVIVAFLYPGPGSHLT
jgi:hypothetical protein